MRNIRLAFTTLAVSALLAACGGGGPARPQVKQIDYSDGTRVMMTYETDHLATVRTVAKDGTVNSEATATYDGPRLSTFSVGQPGKTPTAYAYTYDEQKRLSKISATSGNTSYAYTATYAEGRISRTDLALVSGGSNTTTTIDYTYTPSGQLKERKNTTVWTLIVSGVTRSTETFTYSTETGLLKEIQVTGDSGSTLYELTYDTLSRLSKVVGGGSTYTVEYGTDGNVSRTNLDSNGTVTYKSYTYTGTTVSGILANPMISYGELFDLAGRILPTDQVYVSSSLMGLQ